MEIGILFCTGQEEEDRLHNWHLSKNRIVTCCVQGRIEIPIARQRIELCIREYN
jgi:hypothetical protein